MVCRYQPLEPARDMNALQGTKRSPAKQKTTEERTTCQSQCLAAMLKTALTRSFGLY
jgi:hypothetical protein